jgi:endonuclease I
MTTSYKNPFLTCLFALISCCVWAQGPNNTGTYYQKAHGKKGAELKTALSRIINAPAVVEYDSLWMAYVYSDSKMVDDKPIIWDMYSNISAYPAYPIDNTIHKNGSPEGTKGFQREHSMPKSWFNPTDAPKSGTKTYQDVRPMFSDVMHVIPAEGMVNNWRSNYPYGENGGEFHQSANSFSKMGACTYIPTGETNPVFTGRCFEPNDEYKGDLARIYFYMITCYEPLYPSWMPVRDANKAKIGEQFVLSNNHCGTWTGDMFDSESDDYYQPFTPWALDMLMNWSKKDPVSQKEINRNEAIWKMQGNRNPFIDYPGLEDYIWGDKTEETFDYGGEPADEPTSDNCEVALNKSTLGVDWSETENIRNYWTRTPIIFEKDGITFTFNIGMEGKNFYADESEIRLYNYNTLTLTAHNNEITKVEFTSNGNNSEKKTLVASVGDVDATNNIWTGSAQEVTFASNYVSSTKAGGVSIYYYLGLSNAMITVANPTGIQQLEQPVVNDDHVYNLWGVRMDERQLKPGIYIKNGRKFIIR